MPDPSLVPRLLIGAEVQAYRRLQAEEHREIARFPPRSCGTADRLAYELPSNEDFAPGLGSCW